MPTNIKEVVMKFADDEYSPRQGDGETLCLMREYSHNALERLAVRLSQHYELTPLKTSSEWLSICKHPTCAASAGGIIHTKEQCANSVECCHKPQGGAVQSNKATTGYGLDHKEGMTNYPPQEPVKCERTTRVPDAKALHDSSCPMARPQERKKIELLKIEGTLDNPLPLASHESVMKLALKINEIIDAL